MGFADEFDQHQKENAMNGDFFKFKKDGNYKFRIMCEPVKKVSRYGVGICYEGAPYCQKQALEDDYKKKLEEAKEQGKDSSKIKPTTLNIKWMVWAFLYDFDSKEKKFLDSGKFVIFDMSNPVATALREFMESDEYSFSGWPMPYDIMIKVKNAGLTSAEYTVIASRKNSELSAEMLEEYSKLSPIQQIKERLQAKQKAKFEGVVDNSGIDYPEEEINPDDIPF